MRVIQVMFDTLSREYLPNYGNSWVIAPNFRRLEQHCCTFDHFYGGSMPCMPARRELHTGQYNFLHRSWGPLEPFDDSAVERLKNAGVYTHLCSDHSHYWEDGGATYHNRYNTWEGFRGQEGDRWQPHDGSLNAPVPPGRSPLAKTGISVDQHYANMTKQREEAEISSVKTFEAGLEFLAHHRERDNWFLQIETFDPHEPYEVPQEYRALYGLSQPPVFNWGIYQEVDAAGHDGELSQIRKEYAALITLCDKYLGKVLDFMDAHHMWEDTVLMVNTDHGFLLGEHEFIGKNFPPMYQELVHLPFFLHIPGVPYVGRSRGLCQTIDIPATLLDLWKLEKPADMMGNSLLAAYRDGENTRDAVLYGVFGSYVGLCDSRYSFLKAPAEPENMPLYQYTLMPANARGFFSKSMLAQAELTVMDGYSHGIPVLKMPAEERTPMVGYERKEIRDLIFDLNADPGEKHPIDDAALKERLTALLRETMKRHHSPEEQFVRLGVGEDTAARNR